METARSERENVASDKRHVQCCAELGLGDEQTEMFDLHTGVRQGCVMSPVLFSFS